MDADSKPQIKWSSRDAFMCILALIVSKFFVQIWIYIATRNNPKFPEWLHEPSGLAFYVFVQGGLWLFFALWFSREASSRNFVISVGLKKPITGFGWCAAWAAIGIASFNVYGASRGWTASSMRSNSDYYSLGLEWWFFAIKTIFIVPFYEETVTRGFLYPAFRSRYGTLLATCLIICFSAYFHWGSLSRSAFTTVCLVSLWILLCTVREQTGSLRNCILCHAVYNAVTIRLWGLAIIVMVLLLPILLRRALAIQRETIAKKLNPDVG